MKCALCNAEIEEGFLGKLKGTVVRVKKGDKNEIVHVCPACQKAHGNSLKEKVAVKG